MDDFYEQLSDVSESKGFVYSIFSRLEHITYIAIFASFFVIVGTRVWSGLDVDNSNSSTPKRVPMVPYSIPLIGHSLSFFSDPLKFMSRLRDNSQSGIFSLNLGGNTVSIVSNPHLVKDVMTQRETTLQFRTVAWTVLQRFFGFPGSSIKKHMEYWEELSAVTSYLMKEPYLSNIVERFARGLEVNIPNMISFQDSEIDLQPWERSAKTTYISPSEAEASLDSLLFSLLGSVSVQSLFGGTFLERNPKLLTNVYKMDNGMNWFMMRLPAWFPWPGIMEAHIARRELWQSLDDQQRALDSFVEGKPIDLSWGDLDDVSDFIRKRHEVFKNRGFKIEERGDLSVLWASVMNSSMLVFWQVLYIHSIPGLVSRIREEINPFIKISKGVTIGKISETPRLNISPRELSRQCPLLKSTYLEALRLVDQPWSIRTVTKDVTISDKTQIGISSSYKICKGSYLAVPHELHMRDPAFFAEPERFDPERFLGRNDDGTLSVDIGTIRPYGGGPSMCKGRILAEIESLSFVATVLSFWDIEPADPRIGWVIPKQQKTSAVSKPVHDTRVRIKRRSFD